MRVFDALFTWFERRVEPYPAGSVDMPPPGFLAFCLYYTRGARLWLALIAILAAAIGTMQVVVFDFIGRVVDWLASADRDTFLATEGGTLLTMALVMLVVVPGLEFLWQLVARQALQANFPQRVRWITHRYLLRQSMAYFQDDFSGRLATRLMQTAPAMRDMLMKLLDVLVYVGVYFIGALVLAAMTDWRLTLPFLVWLALYVVLMSWFVPRLGRAARVQADTASAMAGRIVDTYTNIATVKLFSHWSREEAFARDAMQANLDAVKAQARLLALLNSAMTWLNGALLFMVGAVGIWLWLGAAMTPGALATALALVLRLQGMGYRVMSELSQLFESIGTVRDGMSAIAVPRAIADTPAATVLPRVAGAIRFESVTFNYRKGAEVLSNFDLHISPGEKVGLVGRSGAGKSTLVNLLLRFYDPDSGRVTLDGSDIATVTEDSLRANIGVVTQDTALLHRSVRDNITYGRPDASDAQMIAASRLAEADGFIAALRDPSGRTGYEAHVGERGVRLSGGQRQRIAIARTILKDAPVLVLDEATSALDSEVEAAIQEQLARLMEGKTVLAIAHRLSTISALDRLVVLDAGRIVEQGPHAELLARNGLYARLWARQSGGFLPD